MQPSGHKCVGSASSSGVSGMSGERKPWLERIPSAGPSPSPDGTTWKRRDYVSERQRGIELRNWLAANAEIFQVTGLRLADGSSRFAAGLAAPPV